MARSTMLFHVVLSLAKVNIWLKFCKEKFIFSAAISFLMRLIQVVFGLPLVLFIGIIT